MNPQQVQQKGSDKLAKNTDDEAIIAECVDRFKISCDATKSTHRMALDDLNFLNGEHWDPQIRRQREASFRPCITVNKLPTTLRQLTNTNRMNVPGIKVHPRGQTKMELAQIAQAAIRSIEYRTGAKEAYDTAVNSAAAIGFGYFRLVVRYASADSFDQEIAFERIRNPFTVHMDPSILRLDGSDQQWCIITSKMSRVNFRLEHPDADMSSFDVVRTQGERYSDWMDETQVRVAEYYRIHRQKAKLVRLSNGEIGWKDKLVQLPPGVRIISERDSYRETVQWFKLNACEVLDRAEIPCKWIPVFPVFGDELDINGEVVRRGIVRNAKDPSRMYDYWVTAATEEIAMRQRTPYIGAEGQFEGHEEKWRNANNVSYPYLEYKPKMLGGQLAPPPMRQPMTDVPAGMLTMSKQASDDIKATTGFFDASLGATSNETSGRAIAARDRQGETASFHYMDNLHLTLIHVGRCMLNMWPKVYDGTRELELMAEDRKVSTVMINERKTVPGEDGGATEQVLNDMRNAEFTATISAGPSFDTLRQEAVEGMIETARNWPKLMDVAGDKVIRSMDWPFAGEIADRVAKTIPLPLRIGEDSVGAEGEDVLQTAQGPIPKKYAAEYIMQLEQSMQEAQQALQDAKAGVDKARINAQSNELIAQIQAFSAEEVAELKGWVELLKAKINPPASMTTDVLSEEQPPSSTNPQGV